MRKNSGRRDPAVRCVPVPAAPKVGDYILTAGSVTDDWWKIGLLGGAEDHIYATHTRAAVIRRFEPARLKFEGRTAAAGLPMWREQVQVPA